MMSKASPQPAPAVEAAAARSEISKRSKNQENNTEGSHDTVDLKADVMGSELKNKAHGSGGKSGFISEQFLESARPIKGEDIAMKDADKPRDTVAPTPDNEALDDAQPSASKSKARRKSSGVPEHKNKKLNKKISKAKITHTDASPGDYYFVKLKGYPAWPVIVCDEEMLPEVLLKNRPATAARSDGTYRPDLADGGPKEKERTFPVMFLQTNEFAWTANTELLELTSDTISKASGKASKSLQQAHQIALEKHDLQHFKDLLRDFSEAKRAKLEAKQADLEARVAAKEVKKTPKAKKKSNVLAGEDEDTEMLDVEDAGDEGTIAVKSAKSSTKKRKADDDAKTESVKKPRTTIKLTSTPKIANGTTTPKSVKEQKAEKVVKPKKQTPKAKEEEVIEDVLLPQQELSPDEKRVRKQKEVLYIRHKLQKGLLDKAIDPKVEDMPSMDEWMAKLEKFTNLEVSIIRATKINKVLRNIVKLSANKIPMEDEYRFHQRSTTLLDEWNTVPNIDDGIDDSMTANGNDKDAKAVTSPVEDTNGLKLSSSGGVVEKAYSPIEGTEQVDEEKAKVGNAANPSKEETIVDAAA